MAKRVLITGLGVISSLGMNIYDFWENIKNGEIGISEIKHFDTKNLETKIAGNIENFNITDFVKKKITKKFDKFIQYGLAASIQAIDDSKINENSKINKNNVGIIIGSGIGGLLSVGNNKFFLKNGCFDKVKPNFISNCIISTVSGYLAILYKFDGPNISVSNACATGAYSIYLGEQLIKNNKAKIIIAGGTESAITPLAINGFSAIKALSKNRDPKTASRPWDRDRDGFVISDGSACLILEEYEHAIKRNAKIYAEIAGSYINNDLYHIISPHPEGQGSFLCMKNALKNSKIDINQLDYINAHATSTKIGDISESKAINQLILQNKKEILVSSTKSQTGHLLGAAGSIEALITILALKTNIIPANINLFNTDKDCNNLNLIKKTQKKNINYAMSNSFGFNGSNSSIIFKKFI